MPRAETDLNTASKRIYIMTKKKRLAVFASGTGSNFEAIVNACETGKISADVVVLVCDKPGALVVERAARHGVKTLAFVPKSFPSKADMETAIADFLDENEVDLVCLAGYMRILSSTLLSRYGGRIINIHPSLLPAFQGARAVERAMEYGVKVFGVTIHYVDETVDGGRIIAQRAIPYEGEDIDELFGLIHAVEHELYPATIVRLLADR